MKGISFSRIGRELNSLLVPFNQNSRVFSCQNILILWANSVVKYAFYLRWQLVICRCDCRLCGSILFSLSLCSLWCAASQIPFGLQIVFVCLYITPSHYHHCVNLFEDIELIKFLSDIFCRVCKIKHIISVILYTMIEGNIYIYIYTLSYYDHQLGSMMYYPLYRAR